MLHAVVIIAIQYLICTEMLIVSVALC